jgi:hypothetical protein
MGPSDIAAHPELIYENNRFSQDAWTHDIEKLVAAAGPKIDRDADASANPALFLNWQLAKVRDEQARYLHKTQREAERLFEAVTHSTDGVMQWIRRRW